MGERIVGSSVVVGVGAGSPGHQREILRDRDRKVLPYAGFHSGDERYGGGVKASVLNVKLRVILVIRKRYLRFSTSSES